MSGGHDQPLVGQYKSIPMSRDRLTAMQESLYLGNFYEVEWLLKALQIANNPRNALVSVEVDQAEICLEWRCSVGRIAIEAECDIGQVDAKEGKAWSDGRPNMRAVLGIVATALGSLAQHFEDGLVLVRETFPRLLQARNGRRVKGSEDGHKGMIVLQREAALLKATFSVNTILQAGGEQPHSHRQA